MNYHRIDRLCKGGFMHPSAHATGFPNITVPFLLSKIITTTTKFLFPRIIYACKVLAGHGFTMVWAQTFLEKWYHRTLIQLTLPKQLMDVKKFYLQKLFTDSIVCTHHVYKFIRI